MGYLKLALEQISFAHRYTVGLLDGIGLANWFRMLCEGVRHIAWQVGHRASAQYRLALERVRGEQPADTELIPAAFFTLFGRDSVPDPDPAKYPARGRSVGSLTASTCRSCMTCGITPKPTWLAPS